MARHTWYIVWRTEPVMRVDDKSVVANCMVSSIYYRATCVHEPRREGGEGGVAQGRVHRGVHLLCEP